MNSDLPGHAGFKSLEKKNSIINGKVDFVYKNNNNNMITTKKALGESRSCSISSEFYSQPKMRKSCLLFFELHRKREYTRKIEYDQIPGMAPLEFERVSHITRIGGIISEVW